MLRLTLLFTTLYIANSFSFETRGTEWELKAELLVSVSPELNVEQFWTVAGLLHQKTTIQTIRTLQSILGACLECRPILKKLAQFYWDNQEGSGEYGLDGPLIVGAAEDALMEAVKNNEWAGKLGSYYQSWKDRHPYLTSKIHDYWSSLHDTWIQEWNERDNPERQSYFPSAKLAIDLRISAMMRIRRALDCRSDSGSGDGSDEYSSNDANIGDCGSDPSATIEQARDLFKEMEDRLPTVDEALSMDEGMYLSKQ